MKHHNTVLSEKSRITLGLVIIIIGGIVWLSTMFSTGQANSKAIDEIQAKQDSYLQSLDDIKEDLVEIKVRLGLPAHRSR